MGDEKDNVRLHGWDDGKIYYYDESTHVEHCVNDDRELFEKLERMCRERYGEKR